MKKLGPCVPHSALALAQLSATDAIVCHWVALSWKKKKKSAMALFRGLIC